MSCTYSIDLGIHPAATDGRKGKKNDPYPMQIALTEGSLVIDKSGRYIGFTPDAPASFGQIKGGDIIIFRVLETTPICRSLGRSLEAVVHLTVTFRDYDGHAADSPLTPERDHANFAKSPSHERSLTFTSIPKGMDLPCHFERDSSKGIVTYKVTKLDEPVPYLFSVLAETTIMKSEESETAFFRDDPEMVISPDGGAGGDPTGNGDPAPGQSSVSAATSR